ncbi:MULTISPECIES: hypothetical protein, partial [Providencia]|uniref:hypothetical protein n=1 Tax=Providencia TaxID=586 RepID=UPI0023AAAFE7
PSENMNYLKNRNGRHISRSRGVGFFQVLGSHTNVCSPRYFQLPPSENMNYLKNRNGRHISRIEVLMKA